MKMCAHPGVALGFALSFFLPLETIKNEAQVYLIQQMPQVTNSFMAFSPFWVSTFT